MKRPEAVAMDAVIDDIKSSLSLTRASRSELAAAIRERGFEAEPVARMRRREIWRPWRGPHSVVSPTSATYREVGVCELEIRSHGDFVTGLLVAGAIAYSEFLVINAVVGNLMVALQILAATAVVAIPALAALRRLMRRWVRPEYVGFTSTKVIAHGREVPVSDIAYVTCLDQLDKLARRTMPDLGEWITGFTRCALWCVLAVTRDGVPVLLARDLDRASARAAVVALEDELFPPPATKVRVAEAEQLTEEEAGLETAEVAD